MSTKTLWSHTKWTYLSIFAILLTLLGCAPKGPIYDTDKSAQADTAMVVTAHPLATRAGLDMIREGGNAVDAAVTTQLTLAVVFPRAGNLGGGGFALHRSAGGEVHTLDFREKAPALAHRDMFLDSLGEVVMQRSREGVLAAGVPGTVAGLYAMHQRFGRLPWSQLVEPAIAFARKGFRITQAEADRLNKYQDDFLRFNGPDCPFLKPHWKKGDMLVQMQLAETLELIRDQGRDGFYTGPVAHAIADRIDIDHGLLSLQDLEDYEAVWRDPLSSHFRNYTVHSMPPASSGGVALLQLLEMVEPYDLSEIGFHATAYLHLLAEAERRVYADRAMYLGDMDFYPVPFEKLLDSLYLAESMTGFDPAAASSQLSDPMMQELALPEHYETTHTSIVDAEGHAVSLTTTLNLNYGCKVWVPEAGFFLNSEMDDFSAKPGVPNYFGLVGTEANAIQPGKRMLSSMTPTIIERDGRLCLVIGTPGGATIITSVFQVFLNVAEFDMPLDSAIRAGRFHHQWLPDQIRVEEGRFNGAVLDSLLKMGHQIDTVKSMAVVKAIHRKAGGTLHGAGDPRNPDDHAEGF